MSKTDYMQAIKKYPCFGARLWTENMRHIRERLVGAKVV